MESNSDVLEETTSANLSFFENSCPGNHCFIKTKDSEAAASFTSEGSRPRHTKRKSGGAGGYTCCVLGCYNNSKKQKGLSFHVFPAGKSKEKRLLRKKRIHFISRKDFVPTSGHRVCSEHFQGGKKTSLYTKMPTCK